jgi:hypothetical protein
MRSGRDGAAHVHCSYFYGGRCTSFWGVGMLGPRLGVSAKKSKRMSTASAGSKPYGTLLGLASDVRNGVGVSCRYARSLLPGVTRCLLVALWRIGVCAPVLLFGQNLIISQASPVFPVGQNCYCGSICAQRTGEVSSLSSS